MFKALNLPKANLKLSKKEGKYYIWCITRKKTLLLTPEEWVRQHAIHYLIGQKNVPPGLIISEQEINIHRLNRRCDVVIYGTDQKAKLLVECKAPEISLDQKVLHQIAHYNSSVNVDYLWITNGLQHYMFYINRENGSFQAIDELPDFHSL